MRNEQQEPANTSPLGGDNQARFLAQVKAETPPSGASVVSDSSGRFFWARCNRCLWEYMDATRDKGLAQEWADKHEKECAE